MPRRVTARGKVREPEVTVVAERRAQRAERVGEQRARIAGRHVG